MSKKIRFEIWADFASGASVKVETHKREKDAMNAVDAMNNHNMRELAAGYGFPHGVPAYTIKRVAI